MKNKWIITILFVILMANNVLLLINFNSLYLINGLVSIFGNVFLSSLIIIVTYFLYRNIFKVIRKRKTIIIIIGILLNIILLLINFGFYYFDNKLSSFTLQNISYSSTIVVRNESDIKSIDNLVNKKIGMSDKKENYENYKLGYEFLKENNKIDLNEFYKYRDYKLAINDLLTGKIDALIISSNYVDIYREYFPDLNIDTRKIIGPIKKNVRTKQARVKELADPFTLLVIGADSNKSTYNADVLILMSVNPETKKVVMIDVVRDTYAYNVANGNNDKITHSGWHGNENVVNTTSKLFNTNIDYYVKFNFDGVISLIDMIGGIDINVATRYPVKTKNGAKYFVEPGFHKLNGLETLTLARTRKEIGTSLFSRGDMQMKIIEQVAKQVDANFIIINFFELFSLLQNNISTNMSKENIYYYLQLYANIKNNMEFSHNRLKGKDSNYYDTNLKKNLYTYRHDEDSKKELINVFKKNLLLK